MLQAGTMGHRDVTSSCSTWASDPYCGSRASLVTPIEPADAVLEILLSSLDSPSALSDPAARRCVASGASEGQVEVSERPFHRFPQWIEELSPCQIDCFAARIATQSPWCAQTAARGAAG